MSDLDRLQAMRPALASAANEGLQICIAGLDDEVGPGACGDVAAMLAAELQESGFEIMMAQIMVEGETGHEWVVVSTTEGILSVDVPPSVYEEWDGGGWIIYGDVTIHPSDIVIVPFDREEFASRGVDPYVYPYNPN